MDKQAARQIVERVISRLLEKPVELSDRAVASVEELDMVYLAGVALQHPEKLREQIRQELGFNPLVARS